MTSPLLNASIQIAAVFSAFDLANNSLAMAGEVALHHLGALPGIPEIESDIDRARYLIQRFEKPFPPVREAQKALLEIEGRLYGMMAREGTLPEDLRGRLETLVGGRGEVDRSGIGQAYRWVRGPFIEGLQREMGDRPRGGRAHHVQQSSMDLFPPLSELLGREVYLKREDRQPVGSFKIRGATNLLVHERIIGRKRRPCAASHGNHAQGLTQAADNLGFPQVRLFLPRNASPLKIEQCREMGAEVVLIGETFEEAEDQARNWQMERPDERLLVPAYENPLVAMGQGSIGMEIALEMERRGTDRFAVLVPAGGGGMLAGIATWLAPKIPVFGVESESHPYISQSFRSGRIVQPEKFFHVETDADGIALQRPGRSGFSNILRSVRDVVAIPEDLVRGGIAYLHDEGYLAEGASASPFAALLYGALNLESYGLPPNVPVVLIYSGRNIDPQRLREIVHSHGGGRWRASDPQQKTRALEEALARRGFIEWETVQNLQTAQRGIDFVEAVAANLPEGWDLIDAFEKLNFGSWRPEGEKDIAATLRSLGEYRTRWGGNKLESLLHPYGNRGNQLIQTVWLLKNGKFTLEIAEEKMNLFRIVSRLMVESMIVDLYLDRKSWRDGLGVVVPPESVSANLQNLRRINEDLKRTFGELAGMLGITEEYLRELDHERYAEILRRAPPASRH